MKIGFKNMYLYGGWIIERDSSWKHVEPVKENNGERLNKMGPEPKSRVYHQTRKEDFTEYRRHESRTSRTRC